MVFNIDIDFWQNRGFLTEVMKPWIVISEVYFVKFFPNFGHFLSIQIIK